MKKVISFSLWGDKPIYTVGAVENAKDALTMYPDFECWFYIHRPSVPPAVIEELSVFKHVKVVLKEDDLATCMPMSWRFEAIDDPTVEIMMSRDTDTRFLMREKLAVDEWLASGKLFHIMRDHPHHYNPSMRIFAGMFGTKKLPSFSWLEHLSKVSPHNKFDDQTFLDKYVYPQICNNCIVHTSFAVYNNEYSRSFPIPYDPDCHFVGEYVNPDGSRSDYHTQELRNALRSRS